MITMIVPLAVGNALRIFLAPPAGVELTRILRKDADTFSGPDDPSALVVYEGTGRSALDARMLPNGVPQFYRAYYLQGSTWTASATVSGTPSTTYEDSSTDVLSIVRERLDFGLVNEIERGALTANSGAIEVLTATPVWEDARWPLVTVHLLSEQPAERGLGELIAPDAFDDGTGLWTEHEGWLARVQLAIIGWSQNPDQRIAMRQALRRLVVGNLPVFDDAGMIEIEFSQQDVDAVSGEYPAPVYQSACTLTCLAPVVVGNHADAIADVQVEVISS